MIWSWYRLNTTHAGFKGAQQQLEKAFAAIEPANRFSVVSRLDGQECIIKAPAGVALERPPLLREYRRPPTAILRSSAWHLPAPDDPDSEDL